MEQMQPVQEDGNYFKRQSEPTRDTQFLLKRIDPTESTDAFIHNLMGEIKDSGKWLRFRQPTFRDKSLIGETKGILLAIVNPELRLSEFTKDETMNDCYLMSIAYNDYLFNEGYKRVIDPIDNLTPEEKADPNLMKMNPKVHVIAVLNVAMYIYGSQIRAMDRKEAKLLTEVTNYSEVVNKGGGSGGFFNFFRGNRGGG